MSTKRQRGKAFEAYVASILRNHYKQNECMFLRIPDARSFGFVVQPVPGDFLVFMNEGDVLLECKESQNKSGFPKGNLKQSQIDSLRKFKSGRREGCLLIRSLAEKKCYLFKSSQLEIFEEKIPSVIRWDVLEEAAAYSGKCSGFFDFLKVQGSFYFEEG
jgi:penicillin-binding protein-related factor A (putative recombinase)